MDPLQGTPPGPEYHALTGMCVDLCKALRIDLLFPDLIAGGVIDCNEQEEICRENSTEPERVQALLNIIMKDARTNNCRRFNKFRTVLSNSPNCSFLFQRLDQCLMECQRNQLSSIRKSFCTACWLVLLSIRTLEGINYIMISSSKHLWPDLRKGVL